MQCGTRCIISDPLKIIEPGVDIIFKPGKVLFTQQHAADSEILATARKTYIKHVVDPQKFHTNS